VFQYCVAVVVAHVRNVQLFVIVLHGCVAVGLCRSVECVLLFHDYIAVEVAGSREKRAVVSRVACCTS